MRNFLAMLGRASGDATIVAVSALVVAAVTGAIVISSLIGRVEKLESDLARVRSDLDHPQVRPLASIPDTEAGLRRR